MKSPSDTTSLHLFQCTNLGGMEKAAYWTMDQLALGGLGFRCATPRPFGPGQAALLRHDPEAKDAPYLGRFGWRSQRQFRDRVHEKARDCSAIWITGTDVACLRAVADLRQPKLLAHHFHHFENPLFFLKWKLFYELGCHQLAHLTYPSDFTRNEAIRVASWIRGKSSVVRYHFPVQYTEEQLGARRREKRLQLGLPVDGLIVGNAGWLTRRKRWDVFLQTASRVLETIPDARFVALGGGPEEASLRKLADELGISGSVIFTGWREDVDEWFGAFDVLLFNSDFDTLPRTPGEAMGQGCIPVASLAYGGLGELIRHGENGCLLTGHDVVELAETICELHGNPAMAAEWRQAGAATLAEEYGVEQAVGPYRAFLTGELSCL